MIALDRENRKRNRACHMLICSYDDKLTGENWGRDSCSSSLRSM